MRVVPSPAWAVADADVVIVAVKPGDVAASLEAAESSLRSETLVLSIAAGVTIAALEGARARPAGRARDAEHARARRARRVGDRGRTHAADKHLDLASRLLGAVGIVVTVSESALDAVTGLSGSGPAYVFLVAEAMIEAGVLDGLARDVAEQLVEQTLLGSATLLAQSAEGPEALRAAVTSPGGTTAAGLRELESAAPARRDPRRGERGDAPFARARRTRMTTRAGAGATRPRCCTRWQRMSSQAQIRRPGPCEQSHGRSRAGGRSRMSKAKNRPPRLESKIGPQESAPPPTLEERLERSHVAGRALARTVGVAPARGARRDRTRAAGAPRRRVGVGERGVRWHRGAPEIDPALTISGRARRA